MVNKVMLIGHLGQDPERRETRDGATFCTMSLATAKKWKDKNSGERKKSTTWHRVTVFREATAKYCLEALRKGEKIYVEGELATDKYVKNGETRYITYVRISGWDGQVINLDKRSDDRHAGYDGPGSEQTQPRSPSDDAAAQYVEASDDSAF